MVSYCCDFFVWFIGIFLRLGGERGGGRAVCDHISSKAIVARFVVAVVFGIAVHNPNTDSMLDRYPDPPLSKMTIYTKLEP